MMESPASDNGAATEVAFLGLGVMGFPMAGHLLRNGHGVRAWNRSRARAEDWASAHGVPYAAGIAEAVTDADFVMLCVGRDEDVRSVMAEALPHLSPGAIVVDHTTTSAGLAREMAALSGGRYLDAPVSGGQSGATAGTLSIMVGGEEALFRQAVRVMTAYGSNIHHMGPSGAGQLTKMANQICIAGLLEGLAEAQHFAETAGLDLPQVLQAIGGGAARSWQMENRWGSMAENRFDFGFAVDWMRKDLGYCLAAAREQGASLPVTALVDQLYGEVQAMGGGRWDTSSLVARYRHGLKNKE